MVLCQIISWPLACPFQITGNMSFMHFNLHNLDRYKRTLVDKQPIKITVVHDMTPCNLVDRSQRVGGTSYLTPQGRKVNRKFHPFSIPAGLLATSQYSEGPATGHLDTGFSWLLCA